MPAALHTWAPTTSSKCGTALDRHHGTIPGLWGCVPKCPQVSRILITWRANGCLPQDRTMGAYSASIPPPFLCSSFWTYSAPPPPTMSPNFHDSTAPQRQMPHLHRAAQRQNKKRQFCLKIRHATENGTTPIWLPGHCFNGAVARDRTAQQRCRAASCTCIVSGEPSPCYTSKLHLRRHAFLPSLLKPPNTALPHSTLIGSLVPTHPKLPSSSHCIAAEVDELHAGSIEGRSVLGGRKHRQSNAITGGDRLLLWNCQNGNDQNGVLRHDDEEDEVGRLEGEVPPNNQVGAFCR